MWSAALNDANLSSSQAQTFYTWGSFKGDKSYGCGSGLKTCATNAANTPWGWDDSDDGATFRGEWALDPAAHLFVFKCPVWRTGELLHPLAARAAPHRELTRPTLQRRRTRCSDRQQIDDVQE